MYPEAIGSKVVSVRATQKGDVLILLDKRFNKEGFIAKVKRVVGDFGDVRSDSKKVTLDIRNLDSLATEEEVKVELQKASRNEQTQTNPDVKVLNPNQRGLKLAIVVLPENKATKLKELSHLKVRMMISEGKWKRTNILKANTSPEENKRAKGPVKSLQVQTNRGLCVNQG